jgi:uncharacterized membrane protein YeaQ/YmgE (transglycosylase-associated protein family)
MAHDRGTVYVCLVPGIHCLFAARAAGRRRDGRAGDEPGKETEMNLVGLLVLLIVAAVVGAIGEMIAGGKVPGGWIGSILVGLVGAWLGGLLLHWGPVIGGIQIIPAIIGAALFVFLIRLVSGRVPVR